MKRVKGTQGADDVEISIQYRSLEACKSADTYPFELIKYPFSIYLGEAARSSSEDVFLPFIATLQSEPNILSLKIRGEVFVKGPSQTVRKLVLPEDGKPPRIWYSVYQDILLVISTLGEYMEFVVPGDLLRMKRTN